MIGDVSTGAADDLAKATDIAHDMVARYGMSSEVGPVVHERARPQFLDLPGGLAPEHAQSDDTARRIDAAVRALVEEALARATMVLSERRALLDDGAARLLAQETLTEADLRPLLQAARQGAVPP